MSLGIFNVELSQRLKSTILSQGGTVDALELYRRFMGREPNQEALLRRAGLQ